MSIEVSCLARTFAADFSSPIYADAVFPSEGGTLSASAAMDELDSFRSPRGQNSLSVAS
jgi:hypothetical protein